LRGWTTTMWPLLPCTLCHIWATVRIHGPQLC